MRRHRENNELVTLPFITSLYRLINLRKLFFWSIKYQKLRKKIQRTKAETLIIQRYLPDDRLKQTKSCKSSHFRLFHLIFLFRCINSKINPTSE